MTGSGEWQAEPSGWEGAPEASGGGSPNWINVGIILGVVAILGMAVAIVALLVGGGDGGGETADEGDRTVTTPTTEAADPAGDDPNVTMTAVADLQEGMCLNVPQAVQETEEESVDVTDVPVVDCTIAHDLEIYAAFDLEDGVWRGSETVLDEAMDGCGESFETFVGIPLDDSELEVNPLRPTIDSWEGRDDRRVNCMVGDPNGQTAGTLEGAAR